MSKIVLAKQATTPPAPAASDVIVYAKTDNSMYWEDSAGSEHPFGGGGAGISAGTQSVASGTVVFSNSNGVTFGMSGSSRITASVAAPGPGALAAGTQTATSGTVVFSNANNVTFGMAGSTQVTASASFPAQTVQAAVNVAGGTQTATSGTVVFSNSNGISFGLSGSTRMTASADDVKSISAGTTRITNGEVVLGDSNGIFFGVNGQTITARPVQMSAWINNPSLGQVIPQTASLYIQRVTLPLIDATQLDQVFNISNSASAGATIHVRAGLYNMSGSTISLLSSASRGISYNSTMAASSYSNASNTKFWSMALGTWAITPGAYMLGIVYAITTALTSGTFQVGNVQFGLNGVEYNPAGSHNYTKYWNHAAIGTASTTVLPTTAHLTDFNQLITNIGNFPPFAPFVQLVGTF